MRDGERLVLDGRLRSDALKNRRKPRGYTLLELMVVVGIMGLLSSVAIPGFRAYTCKSRRTEVRTVVRTIQGGLSAYEKEHERSVAVDAVYTGTVSCAGVFTSTSTDGRPAPNFAPKGRSRYAYTYYAGPSYGGAAVRATGCAGSEMEFDVFEKWDNGYSYETPGFCKGGG